jgi:arsenate reductase (thioredoxin)
LPPGGVAPDTNVRKMSGEPPPAVAMMLDGASLGPKRACGPANSRDWRVVVRRAESGSVPPNPWVLALCFLAAGAAFAAPIQHARSPTTTSSNQRRTTVLFLCPHGAAKSVLASAYFQRVAQERGLDVRVESAGIEPQEAVSTVVAEHLQRNGYTAPVAKPRAVTKDDLARADVVISMGCDLTHLPSAPRTLQKWDDVPGPSEDFKGADDVIRRRVIALVEELLSAQTK